MKITNKILKREINKDNNYLYFSFIFIAIAILLIVLGIYENRKNTDSYTYLNDVIENKNNEENINAYLDIAQTPYSIAKYEDDDKNAFYIAFDGRYFYIVYLSDELFNTLNVEGLEDNPITIYGTTLATPDEVREIAIEVYNEGLDEEDQISLDDYNNYFGEVYLTNTSLKKVNYIFYILSSIPIILSLSFIVIFINKKIKTKKALKKYKDEIDLIEKEIEEDSSFYDQSNHLILTDHYLLSFKQKPIILKYNDLLWIYENRLKNYGITVEKEIYIMNKDGKTFKIYSNSRLEDKDKTKDIINRISSKNNSIIIGLNKKKRRKNTRNFK